MIRGSLEGVEGVLVRKKSLLRLVLSVDMMAQSVAVEIDAADVEPLRQQHSAVAGPMMPHKTFPETFVQHDMHRPGHLESGVRF